MLFRSRKPHKYSHFAAATIRHLKDLATLLGGQKVFVLSQDDKARVPLGLAAANKQAPILMCLQYRIRLPDHDWVVGPGHKLIPSDYAALDVGDDGVGYSGATYVAIRSGKHDKSTSASHSADFRELENLAEFHPLMTLSNKL